MGNEMGNSNTSGLQEEEISTTQVQESSVKEAGQADGREVENHNASLAEVKDHSEKEKGAATNVPNGAADPHVANQASHERWEKEAEVKPPAESLTVEVKSNATEESHESSEMQPNSISHDSKENEKLLGNTDGQEGGNNIVSVSEDKDYQEKEINGFLSGVPNETENPHFVNQISGEREEETEVLPPAGYPKFDVKTNNEAGSEVCDTQPTSPSKHSTDREIQQESNLEENLPQSSDRHLKNQTSIKKEEEGTETSTSVTVQRSNDPDPQELEYSEIDQPELANIHVDLPMEDSNKSLHIHDDIQGTNLNCTSEESGHAIGTDISKDTNGTVVSGSNLEAEIAKEGFPVKERAAEEVSCEGRLEIVDMDEIGNDLGEKSVIKSDLLNGVGIKCNGGNNTVPVSEDKDYLEKEINGFPSGVLRGPEDPHTVNQISDEREQETEVPAPAESPKFDVKTNHEAGSEVCDTQLTSPSKHSEHQEIQQESNLKENLLQISDHHLEKRTSIEKEEEGTETSTSEAVQLSHDPDPQEFEDSKFDQPELANILVDLPRQDGNNSLHVHEDIQGSNLNCTCEEDGQAIGANITKDMSGTVASGSNLEAEIGKDDFPVNERAAEELSCEDRLEIEDKEEIGNDLGEKPVIKSDLLNGVEIKCHGEIPVEKNPISNGSPKAESEVTIVEESQNPQIGVSEAKDNCIVHAAETRLVEKESEPVENKPTDSLTDSCEESVKESKIDSEKLSQSESLMIETEGENNQEGVEDFACCGGYKDCIEEAKVAKNGGLVDEHSNDQNEGSMEHSEDSQKEVEMVTESGTVSTDSALADCKREEASEDRQIFEEVGDKTKASYGNENSKEARENGEQCVSAVEQEEASLTKAPISILMHQDNQQKNEMQAKNMQNGNGSISELKPEINGEFLVTEASPFDSKKSMAETLTPVAESAVEKPEQDISHHTAETMMAAAEANGQANNAGEQYADAQESMGRLSTESNSNNSSTQAQMQKSPSFDLDLRIEARTEESDRTPLLYQDKTATEDFSGEQDVSLGSPIARAQDQLQYHAMPVEEKVVGMERSDSEKMKTPFLGFLKEEGEASMIVTPQVHGNSADAKRADKESLNLHTKEVTANSKEKRKPRSSLFTTCICCTTVLN